MLDKNNSNFPHEVSQVKRHLTAGACIAVNQLFNTVFTPKLLVFKGRLLHYPISKKILKNDLHLKKNNEKKNHEILNRSIRQAYKCLQAVKR